MEFVSRNIRKIAKAASFSAYLAVAGPAYGAVPDYEYQRIAKINENFPVFEYTGPGVIAFMDPDNMEIAMPSHERTPYWSRDHVLHHETLHIHAEAAGGRHDERGFNDQAVEYLRNKTGHNFFPFPSY